MKMPRYNTKLCVICKNSYYGRTETKTCSKKCFSYMQIGGGVYHNWKFDLKYEGDKQDVKADNIQTKVKCEKV